jgi:hypothetical protein
MPLDRDEPWVPPDTITLSPRVRGFAREFIESVNGERGNAWIASIGWATSVTIKDSRDAAPQAVGPGLSLGADRRNEVPPEAIDRVDGLEFVLRVPREVWERSSLKRIEFDESLLFKLKLV